jgi:hypothetical protein
LAETASVTVALPLPLVPDVTVSQAAWLVAAQLQPAGAVIATVVLPPAAPIDAPPGLIAYEHVVEGGGTGGTGAGGATEDSAWFTVTDWPATVTVPDRAAPVFTPAARLTIPLPTPADPDATLSHPVLLEVDQAQPGAAVTVMLAAPPVAGIVWVAGLTLY